MDRKERADHRQPKKLLEKRNNDLNWLNQMLCREIARRKKLQAKLRETEQRYAAIAEMQRELVNRNKHMEEVLQQKRNELNGILDNYQRLTPREREVMNLVVEGQLNKEIAAKTGVTERTIKFHRHQIMERMHAGSLAELARMAEKLADLNSITQNNTIFETAFVA